MSCEMIAAVPTKAEEPVPLAAALLARQTTNAQEGVYESFGAQPAQVFKSCRNC